MIILITGITSGFGKAMAQSLSAEGHKVYGTHRRECERIPGVTYIKADACIDEEVQACVNQVMEAEGRIDVFINNAGMGIGGPLEFCSIEDAERQMDTNWTGMVRFLHRIIPIMRKQGEGKIICLSSIGGKIGLPYQGLYSASKYAIEGYCEALRLELRKTGVKVIVIEPGDFSTGFTGSRKKVVDPAVNEAYPSYARSLASIEKDETTGLKPDFLARKIVKIVKKKHPRQHYMIATVLQKMGVWIRPFLPPCAYSWVISKFYNM